MIPERIWLGCLCALIICSVPAWAQPAGATAQTYTEFGIANGKRGDLNAAIAAFDAAVEIDPKFAPAYYFRGLARAQQKDFDGAFADYSKAVEVDPKFNSAYYQRGMIEGRRGDFDAAGNDFQQVINLDPKNAEAYYSLGDVCYFRGDLDTALTNINQSIKLQPESGPPYYIRGLIFHAKGQNDDALKDFKKSVGLNFTYGAFWSWMIQMDNREHGMAEQDLTNAMARPAVFTPDDWPSQIGNMLLGKISFDQLRTIAGQGDPMDVNERKCEALFYGGVVRRFEGDDRGAKELFQKAIDTDVKSAEEYVEAKRFLGN
jgi:tetratricopeptide (TPR) repeat protein